MSGAFVLVHSPLVGPTTWAPVADELERRGGRAVVPVLPQLGPGESPYWERHAAAVAQKLNGDAAGGPVVLVGHSGAGTLLPAIGRALWRPVAAYIFVDASLPLNGLSRLQEVEQTAPELGPMLRRHLEGGGYFPDWADEDLRESIPDESMRAAVLAEVRPQPLAFFAEPIPPVEGWPEAPCAYVQLSPGYAPHGEQAQRQGWPYRRFNAGHFHLVVEPGAVAGTLMDLAAKAGYLRQ